MLDLDPNCTILTGTNQTGKSSLIKTIFYAFGAESAVMLKGWKDDVSKILVYFHIGERDYQILRDGGSFTVFKDGEAIHSSTSVTNELGPFLASLFRFGLKMTSRTGELITPPPAYFFLPFYFDQEQSWKESWKSFKSLDQIPNFKRDLIDYHIGLKPNEFYEAKAENIRIKTLLAKIEGEQKILKTLKEQALADYQEVSLAVDLESFLAETTELLTICKGLQLKADAIKEELVELHSRKIELESQISITSTSLSEIDEDFTFLKKQTHSLGCPTCGAEYNSDFTKVFNLASDSSECERILSFLKQELLNTNREIDKFHQDHARQTLEAERIRTLLATKRDEVKLEDLIDSESKKKLKSVLGTKHRAISEEVFKLAEAIQALAKRMDSFVSKDRKTELKGEFQRLIKKNLESLSVYLPENSYKDYDKNIQVQGSEQPRALLAYRFSIIEIMHRAKSSVFFPIIIDSPNQQEQDGENRKRMIEFIKASQPEGSQLILAAVEVYDIDFNGTKITSSQKYAVLQSGDYESLHSEVEPYILASYQYKQEP